jgi:flavodoxin
MAIAAFMGQAIASCSKVSGNSGSASSNKTLVVYFSLTGNTRIVAEQIHRTVGGEILEIKTVTQYPQEDRQAQMDIAMEEQRTNARPALATQITNLASYDTVYIGYPIWFGKMPMLFLTLFEQYDFAGKTIIPFSTFGGNGGPEGVERSHNAFLGTVTNIKQISPQSTVLDGFGIQGERVRSAGNEIAAWLDSLNTLKK